jgi:hypothetical protein
MFYALYSMKLKTHQITGLHSKNSVLEFEEEQISPLFSRAYQLLWGDWAGREENFYKNTYERIASLSRYTFLSLGGISQKILLKELKQSHRNLENPKVPKILMRNPKLVVTKFQEDSYCLSGYAALDPLRVPKKIYDIIDWFDGTRPNREVLQILKDKKNFNIDSDLLKTLYMFRILISGEQVENVGG